MNRRQVTTAMVLGGTALALGQRSGGRHGALAGGWASLEFINPPQVAVVGVPIVIDAQILQHGISPNPDFGGSIRFAHDTSGAFETLRLEVISRAHAIARGEHTFSEAGTWHMATQDMGVDVELGTLEVVDPGDDDVISMLRPAPEVAAVCGDAANVVETEILDSAFADQVLEVAAGTTVRWVNTSAVPHQLASEDGAFATSPMLRQGDSFSQAFDTAGEFAYYCVPHPHMTGVVKVTS